MAVLRRSRLLLCIVSILIALSSASAQQYGDIAGEVHASRGDLPGRVMVELQLHGSPIASEYTDEQGKFGFGPVTSNSYHIIIHDDRFYPVDQRVMVDLSISAVTMVQITLMPREQTKAQSASPGPVSGGNPYVIDLSEYKRHFPKGAVKEFDKGVDADKEHRTDDAIHHYEKAIAEAPDFYPARNNLGSDYLAKSDFLDAEKQFQEAIRLNKDDSQAYFNLGNVLSLTGKLSESEKVLKDGLQKRPDSAFGHFLLGSLYSRAGVKVEAERNLQEALKLDPNMPQAYLQLVNLYMQEKRDTEAITELQAFLHSFPDGPFTPKARQVLKKLQAEQRTASH
jgi:tetratricopeptide (TPR) repeat protein